MAALGRELRHLQPLVEMGNKLDKIEHELAETRELVDSADPEMAQEIMRLFLEVNARGTTVVVATHDREMIQRMGKRVISLERGRVASA